MTLNTVIEQVGGIIVEQVYGDEQIEEIELVGLAPEQDDEDITLPGDLRPAAQSA